ncbi:hypothetical protein FOA52_006500, partial [Chlamydomonas sp. UWO 241]
GLPHYYTMSSSGVTALHDGAMEFVSLDAFERDYILFTRLMRLRVYKSFR